MIANRERLFWNGWRDHSTIAFINFRLIKRALILYNRLARREYTWRRRRRRRKSTTESHNLRRRFINFVDMCRITWATDYDRGVRPIIFIFIVKIIYHYYFSCISYCIRTEQSPERRSQSSAHGEESARERESDAADARARRVAEMKERDTCNHNFFRCRNFFPVYVCH